ncbi:hypothetical protein PM082_012260 [Marasmius tenuissimus]|nr:hypothetical protein PM082_012260 [Marasmius tenuissimus]
MALMTFKSSLTSLSTRRFHNPHRPPRQLATLLQAVATIPHFLIAIWNRKVQNVTSSALSIQPRQLGIASTHQERPVPPPICISDDAGNWIVVVGVHHRPGLKRSLRNGSLMTVVTLKRAA